jgi:hypothetical protein
MYQEALHPATGRNSRRGDNILGRNILGHNIHGDMHASHICGGRQQCFRVLAVAHAPAQFAGLVAGDLAPELIAAR